MATTSDPAGAPAEWISPRLVDVTTGSISPPSSVAIKDGLISATAVGPPPSNSHNIVDVKGLYVLPGLITCHVHLQGRYPYSLRDPNEPPDVTAARATEHAHRLVPHGIAAVRSVHEQARADLRVRAAFEHDPGQIPTIRGAGRALTAPMGHGDGLGAVVARGRDEFYRAATNELEAGADHVKLFASGGLARGGESLDRAEITGDEMAATVQAATEHGAYVVAHAATSTAIRLGILAGVRSFEHAYILDDDTAEQLAERHLYLTPTLVVTHALDWMTASGFAIESIAHAQEMAATHMASTRRAIAAGALILHGTDFPPSAGSGGTTLAVRELELLVEAGLSPLAALQSATTTPARLMALPASYGTLRIGASADMIAVEANPVGSVSSLREMRMVIRAGYLVKDATGAPAGS